MHFNAAILYVPRFSEHVFVSLASMSLIVERVVGKPTDRQFLKL